MSNWCKYCLILAVFLSIPCCRQAPPSPKTAATIAYDDSVYCFRVSGAARCSRTAFSAGCTCQAFKFLSIYAGAGYADDAVLWEL